jgi:squalene synthase HpnC
MTSAGELRSGKSHRDENFPVASWLIHPRHRAPILAFYQFVRTADDIADHAELKPDQKLALLDQLEADLDGAGDRNPEAVALRKELEQRALSPRHAKDLLTAFRLDVTKLRYRDWDDLIGYCAYSAMPVGRFVCDVHGESQAVWPANDALCAALQIINHLQDCQADYRNLNRVYVPLDALAAAGAEVEALGAPGASPALLACLHRLADKTELLLRQADVFPGLVQDRRLGLEIAVIVRLAHHLTRLLMQRDPLTDRVHLSKLAALGLAAQAVLQHGLRSFTGRGPARLPEVSGS